MGRKGGRGISRKKTQKGMLAAAAAAAAAAGKPTDRFTFHYVKVRKQFGRQIRFIKDKSRVHCNIAPSRYYRRKFLRFRFLHKSSQGCFEWVEGSSNTSRSLTIDVSINHYLGAWPKEIPIEREAINRYKRKLEKEDAYQSCLYPMFKRVEKHVRMNNSCDYFGEGYRAKWKHPNPYHKQAHSKTLLVFEDHTLNQRSIKKITWAPENTGRMGVCYLPKRFGPDLRNTPTEAFFWDAEIASRPESQVRSPCALLDIAYHHKDTYSICGACMDGTVIHWDQRVGPNPAGQTPRDVSHTDFCTGASWLPCRTNSELFSVGRDGQALWWDIRNFNERLESMVLDPEKGQSRLESALPASCLEFKTEVPTKFLVGTENGYIMVMQRKGKTPAEKLVNVYRNNKWPISDIQRNPTFVKTFVTVSGPTVRVFSEESKESNIMWTPISDVHYTHASWVPSRPSNIIVTRDDGHYEVYDLLKKPTRRFKCYKVRHSLQNKKKPKRKYKRELMQDIHFTCAAACPAPSFVLAIGSSKGNIYLEKLTEPLYLGEKTDKALLAAVFERETRREKFIEQRYREIRLRKRDKEKQLSIKQKTEQDRIEFAEKYKAEADAEGKEAVLPDYSVNAKYDLKFEALNDPILKVQREFYLEVEREVEEKGLEAWPGYSELPVLDKGLERDARTTEEALDITAEDLAAFAFVEDEEDEFDDDGRPIPKGDKK